jgi:hypothetical protein
MQPIDEIGAYMKTKEKRVQALDSAAERYLAHMGEASQVVFGASVAIEIMSDHFDDKT